MESVCRILVLISGNGSNLQAIIDGNKEKSKAQIVGVISDNIDAFGLIRAQKNGIANQCVIPKQGETKEDYENRLRKSIETYQPDLIVLAGFMRILSANFVNHYQGKIINIHPSLLPKYTGLNTHQRAIDANDTEHGVSVHFVIPELDKGPVILQAKVPVYDDDTAEVLASRVLEQEHSIYPLVVKWFAEGRLQMQQNQAWLDGKMIGDNGYAPD